MARSILPCGHARGPCTSNRSGAERTRRYLARYVYHVALTNHRLESFAHGRVTFRHTLARTHATRRVTLPVDTFITSCLDHVLPRGFTKIRYLWSPESDRPPGA